MSVSTTVVSTRSLAPSQAKPDRGSNHHITLTALSVCGVSRLTRG
jgi:hypothetical protein